MINDLAEEYLGDEETDELCPWVEKMLVWGENQEFRENLVAGVGFKPMTSGL